MKTTQSIRSGFWRKMAILFVLKTVILLKPNIEAQQITSFPAITTMATNDVSVMVDVSATPPASGTTKKFQMFQLADLFSTTLPKLDTGGRVRTGLLEVFTNGVATLQINPLASGVVQIINAGGDSTDLFSDTQFNFNNPIYAPSFVGSAVALTNFPPQVLFTNYAFVSASGFVNNPQVGNTWKPYSNGTDARNGLVAGGFTNGVIYFLPGNYAATSLTATNVNLYFARGATAPTLTLYNTLTNTIHIDGNGIFTNDMDLFASTVLNGDLYGTGVPNQSLITCDGLATTLTINATSVKADISTVPVPFVTSINAENLELISLVSDKILITAKTIRGVDFILSGASGSSVINCDVIDADSFSTFAIGDSGVANVEWVFNVASIINQSPGQELLVYTTGGFSVGVNFSGTVMDLPVVLSETIPTDGLTVSGSRFIR